MFKKINWNCQLRKLLVFIFSIILHNLHKDLCSADKTLQILHFYSKIKDIDLDITFLFIQISISTKFSKPLPMYSVVVIWNKVMVWNVILIILPVIISISHLMSFLAEVKSGKWQLITPTHAQSNASHSRRALFMVVWFKTHCHTLKMSNKKKD